MDRKELFEVLRILEDNEKQEIVLDYIENRERIAYEKGLEDGKVGKWREVTLYSGMVSALIRVYKWCLENNRNEFTRQDIKESILLSENDTARWGDWIIFGSGMVYKPEGKGSWGLNMERVKEFLDGNKVIPIRVAKKGREIKIVSSGTIRDIPNLMELLDEDLKYMVRYYSEVPSMF